MMTTPRARDRKNARHKARQDRRASQSPRAGAHRAERRSGSGEARSAATPPTIVTPPLSLTARWPRVTVWLVPLFIMTAYLLRPTPGADVPSTTPLLSMTRVDRSQPIRLSYMSRTPMTKVPRAAGYSVPPPVAVATNWTVSGVETAVASREAADTEQPRFMQSVWPKLTSRAPVQSTPGHMAVASTLPRIRQSQPGHTHVDDALEPTAPDHAAAPDEPASSRKSWVRFSRLNFPPHPRNPHAIDRPAPGAPGAPGAMTEPPAIMAALQPLILPGGTMSVPVPSNPHMSGTASQAVLCSAPASLTLASGPRRATPLLGMNTALESLALGRMISDAAVAQINDLVVYRAAYSRIAFPMGDVSPMFGVCTDVVIRALREVGIDLQEQVQRTRTGNGDTNIDHRRVDTLKRYFALHGETAPISEFAEDYQPGDIVTYFRPWNRTTTTHIAVVSHVIAPSGRPMIVHNRGWGAQLEDALLVDRITGHYRVLTAQPQPAVARTPGGRIGAQAASALSLRRVPSVTALSARSGG